MFLGFLREWLNKKNKKNKFKKVGDSRYQYFDNVIMKFTVTN